MNYDLLEQDKEEIKNIFDSMCDIDNKISVEEIRAVLKELGKEFEDKAKDIFNQMVIIIL
jgi:Ca2+-binding EF-hand superfamily protein